MLYTNVFYVAFLYTSYIIIKFLFCLKLLQLTTFTAVKRGVFSSITCFNHSFEVNVACFVRVQMPIFILQTNFIGKVIYPSNICFIYFFLQNSTFNVLLSVFDNEWSYFDEVKGS